MTDKNWIHETVERVTSEVFEGRVAELRQELVRRTVEEIQPSLATGVGAVEKLLAAVVVVQTGDGPREILQRLLDQSVGFCGRSALFILNEESAAGWQAIGFENNDAIPDFAINQSVGLFQKVIATQSAATGDTGQMDGRFYEIFGAPLNGECHLIPILRKEKVAAVLYADAGNADASCERAALDVLVRFAGLWLEARAMRTFAAPAAEASLSPTAAAVATPASGLPAGVPAWPEPAAAPRVQASAAAATPAVAPAQAAFAAAANSPGSEAFTLPSSVSAPAAVRSAEDAEVHRKAQRFAKLLIDEIRLYNKAKVEEGRKNRDIYDRLRDDIDKSRASYIKRYGGSPAASVDYFTQELIRGLAQEDASLLGPNFQH